MSASGCGGRLWRAERVIAGSCDENVDWAGWVEAAGVYFVTAEEPEDRRAKGEGEGKRRGLYRVECALSFALGA